MNNDQHNSETATTCCRNHCTTVFKVEDSELENSYKCGQQALTAGELWRIQRNRRPVSIRSNFQ